MNPASTETAKVERRRARAALVKAINNYNATRALREADTVATAAMRFIKATNSYRRAYESN